MEFSEETMPGVSAASLQKQHIKVKFEGGYNIPELLDAA